MENSVEKKQNKLIEIRKSLIEALVPLAYFIEEYDELHDVKDQLKSVLADIHREIESEEYK